MKVATWNVNSIKARLSCVAEWLQLEKPDALCMQETKCRDEEFPLEAFEAAGYHVFVHGQKNYNGVAVATKIPAESPQYGLSGADKEIYGARYMEVVLFPEKQKPARIASLYLPNGNPPESDKFYRKLEWMDCLYAHAKTRLGEEEAFILAGDYNIIPAPLDAARIEQWKEDALFHPLALARFRKLLNLGFQDAFRASWHAGGRYSFWDYQGGALRKGNGIRIDHMLLSPRATDRLESCDIDHEPRGWERPSDHAPVWVELN